MKPNLYKLTRWSAALLIAGAGIIACTDLDELENRVNDLESRVTALESQLPALNETIVAISGIVKDGAVITNIEYVEETADDKAHYEFTLSGDTETYKLYNGTAGNVPTIGINEKGNWTVTIDGTTTELTLGEDGAVASAEAVVPQFAIDENGYWTVCTDEDEGFVQVKDPSGAPVRATGTTGSNIFDKVELDEENGVLKIWMAGESDPIEVRVISADEFSCVIKYDGEVVDYDTPVEFSSEENTKEFEVEMIGVENYFITKPQGWIATLASTTLTVKAPTQVQTNAQTATKISANTEKDIIIHAINAEGLSIFAKIQVELLPGAKPTIKVNVDDSESEYYAVSFTLSDATNMTSYKYLLYPEGGTVPTEISFENVEANDATSAPTESLRFTQTSDGQDITYNTSYVLYVMPINTVEGNVHIYGEIVSATAATKTATYYDLYNDGETITIAGKNYDKTTYGEATLVSEDASITAIDNSKIIYFVNSDATLTFNASGKAVAKLIIIGNNLEQRSPMKISCQVALNQGAGNTDGTLVLYNLDVDASNANAHVFAQNRDGAYGYVGIIGSSLKMPAGKQLSYVSTTARSFAEFVFEDSEIEIPSTSQAKLFSFSESQANHGKISFKNNILYSEGGVTDFRIYEGSKTTLDSFTFENNTVVNLWSSTTGCVLYTSLENVSVTKNIFWTNKTTANMCIFRPSDTSAETGIPYTGNPTGTLVDDNYVYKNGESTNWQWFFGGINRVDKAGFSACNEIIAVTNDPLSIKDFNNVVFTPTAQYSGYGAQR